VINQKPEKEIEVQNAVESLLLGRGFSKKALCFKACSASSYNGNPVFNQYRVSLGLSRLFFQANFLADFMSFHVPYFIVFAFCTQFLGFRSDLIFNSLKIKENISIDFIRSEYVKITLE